MLGSYFFFSFHAFFFLASCLAGLIGAVFSVNRRRFFGWKTKLFCGTISRRFRGSFFALLRLPLKVSSVYDSLIGAVGFFLEMCVSVW